MQLPVLMFDFGNVVGFFDYSALYHRFGLRLGLSAEQFEAMMHERGASRLGREFERGKLSAEEFAHQMTALAGLEMSFEEFDAQWADIFTLNEPVARLVAALKRRGYTLLLGSNTNVLHARFYRRRFQEALASFDHFVFSYEVGELKPDLAFFTACLDLVGAPAGCCIFIDDCEANVQGAKAAGLQAVVYRDTPSLIAELCRLGVEVPDIEI
jgi:putative hydrolase of the HAD superfamily